MQLGFVEEAPLSGGAEVIRLHGGHRNDVFLINSKVKVVWRDGFERRRQLREGVLLENFIGRHTNIRARTLIDKSKPIQEEDNKLVTYFHYVPGEVRYPWNLKEIASATKLLGRLHQCSRQLHLDFARGNILFSPGTNQAIGVIDFETTAKGPVEQELGRTLSFLLVDTRLKEFQLRWEAFLTNYPGNYRTEEVVSWAIKYLKDDDYGNLNNRRDEAIEWLKII